MTDLNKYVTEIGMELNGYDNDFLYEKVNETIDDSLDIRYIINGDKSYRSCQLAITLGGPNVWIDTEKMAIVGYWGTDQASYPLTSDVVNAIDEIMEEYYNC